MALNFPTSPTIGQIYTLDNVSWKWNGTAWDKVAKTIPDTYVVSTPVFSTPGQAQSGQTVTVRARSESLISDTVVQYIKFGLPSGEVTVSCDATGTAETTFTASGTVGTEIVISAIAIDNLGNLSKTGSHTITISTNFVNQATITSPLNEATNVENGLIIQTSDFASTGTTDTLNYTEFEILSLAGTVLWTAQSVGSLQITVPDNAIAEGSTVNIRARHVGNTLGSGSWSPLVQITYAGVLTPSNFGDPYQGGFYAGRIQLGTSIYAIVVAPKSIESTLAAVSSTINTAGILGTGCRSIDDGWSNTNHIVETIKPLVGTTTFPAAEYCYNLSYGGYTDWYLPSIMELELAYRTLKPGSSSNSTLQAPVSDLVFTSGASTLIGTTLYTENTTLWPVTSYPSRLGTTYTNSGSTATYPSLTTATQFQGQVQEGFTEIAYYSSSMPNNLVEGKYLQPIIINFGNGGVYGMVTASASYSGNSSLLTTARPVRPFRRVFLRTV